MLEELEAIHSDSISAIAEIADTDELEAFRVACLGRKGRLTLIAAQLKDIPKEDKPAAGKALNKVRGAITAAMSEKGEPEGLEVHSCFDNFIGRNSDCSRIILDNSITTNGQELYSNDSDFRNNMDYCSTLEVIMPAFVSDYKLYSYLAKRS